MNVNDTMFRSSSANAEPFHFRADYSGLISVSGRGCNLDSASHRLQKLKRPCEGSSLANFFKRRRADWIPPK